MRDLALASISLTVFITFALMDQGSDGLAHRHTHYIAEHIQIENHDRKLVVTAHGDGRSVHHRQSFGQHFQVADLFVLHGVRIAQRIFVVDAIHAGPLGDDVRMDFERAQRGGGIGGKIRIRGAGCEDHNPALFEMPDGPAADVRFGHLVHLDGGHYAGGHASFFKRVLKRNRVDHRGQHAHVIGRDPVHIHGGRSDAAEEIAAAYDETDLDTGAGDFGDFRSEAFDSFGIDAERTAAGESLAAEFQNDAGVFRHGAANQNSEYRIQKPECRMCPAVKIFYSLGGEFSAVSSISAASPTLNRTKRETARFSPSLAMAALIRSPTVVEFSRMKGCS